MRQRALTIALVLCISFLLLSSVVSAAPLPQTDTTYVIQKGDTLWKIAEQQLGNGAWFPAIVSATNTRHDTDATFARIDNPARIHVGWKLLIPAKDAIAGLMAIPEIKPSESDIIVTGLLFPEGPYWSAKDNRLYYVEWSGDKVWTWKEGKAEIFFETEKGAGPCGIFQDKDGNLWLTLYSTLKVVQLSPDAKILQTFDNYQGQPFRGPNDLVVDAKGGVYFSDSGDFGDDWVTGREAGAVYYITPEKTVVQVAKDLSYSNGIDISPDGKTLYVNEHRKNRVLKYAINEDGTLKDKAVFYQLDSDFRGADKSLSYELGPDGMARDSLGNIWVAHYGGGKLVVISPEGKLIKKVIIPKGFYPNNMTLTPDDKTLYITESGDGLLYRVALP